MRSLLGCALALLDAPDLHMTATQTPPLRFVTVTAAADHVCALSDHGEAYCWGSNEFGQLENGSADSMPHPVAVRVRAEMKFTTVSAGFTHTCGLVRDGSAWCRGPNDTAQLGDGSLKNSPIPVRVSTDVKFQTIGSGGGRTCGVSGPECAGDSRRLPSAAESRTRSVRRRRPRATLLGPQVAWWSDGATLSRRWRARSRQGLPSLEGAQGDAAACRRIACTGSATRDRRSGRERRVIVNRSAAHISQKVEDRRGA